MVETLQPGQDWVWCYVDELSPLGRWVAETRRRDAAAELSADQRSQVETLPGWRWAVEGDVGGGGHSPGHGEVESSR